MKKIALLVWLAACGPSYIPKHIVGQPPPPPSRPVGVP